MTSSSYQYSSVLSDEERDTRTLYNSFYDPKTHKQLGKLFDKIDKKIDYLDQNKSGKNDYEIIFNEVKELINTAYSLFKQLDKRHETYQNNLIRFIKYDEKIKAINADFIRLQKRDKKITSSLYNTLDRNEPLRDEVYPYQQYQQYHIEDQTETDPLMIESRNNEIKSVMETVTDLNMIFRDLDRLVGEQGILVNDIDNNIALSLTHVEEGKVEIKKAETFQKKSSKCCVWTGVILCLIILSLVATIAIIETTKKP